jgi:chromosome segregation ATPase
MTISILLPWLVAAATLAIALVALARVRSARVEASRRKLEMERLRGELGTAREELDRAVAKQRRSSEELAQARRKLEKTKKRVARTDAAPKDAPHSYTLGLEEPLEAARQERDAARNDARRLGDELARLRAEASGETRPEPLLDNEAIEALQKRLAEANGELGSLRNDLTGARKEAARLKEKIKTQELLYVSVRGELQAKKDRLRTQTEELERLRALKVVVEADST